ncbi:3-phosphoserine/phosphohydroxythreonine transaminase [Mariniplasma anaerobium]|uniref:Phosphoserine aminotransferase n=1 Tax=Mariniplasma anaerobium TaxID=2735436 RepID=A0A7U9THY2_9MOLU|nr:3-phosphoserine/phosphohydroxythreonine transaminase [Mariniplasma anaerobium]BCR36630.1 3-phosphoserine/phosphohydroxythreonine aminotransferase [Mariniplasma anaerobium]
MKRVYNFSAGPGVLPEAVLKDAASEMLDYQNNGMSVMEMSHRTPMFQKIIDDAQKDLRTLMNIPDNYKVLFLQGGASLQFSMIPMNLMKKGVADYIVTGAWAKKAAAEAKKFGKVNIIASSEDKMFSYIPDVSDLKISDDADYVHMCDNNTIYGTKFHHLPNTKGKVLVSDISSCILSEEIDVSKFGLLYAGAQKNIGPAGITVVIIREDLIREDMPVNTPTMLRYDIHASKGSMYNTPPTYGIYLCGKTFQWLLNLGGIKAINKINEEKAALLYDYLDQSKLFFGTVEKNSRSIMNVCFKTNDPELDAKFISNAKNYDIVNIKGHRSIGGMRASMYNAMPVDGIKALVDYMKIFEKENLK